MIWVDEILLMFRRCPHGSLHPDPDSLRFRQVLALAGEADPYDGWHPCCPDHCCQGGD